MIGGTHFRNINFIKFSFDGQCSIWFRSWTFAKIDNDLANEYQKDIVHRVRARARARVCVKRKNTYIQTHIYILCIYACICMMCTRRGRQKTRDGTREAQGQTRSRGSTRGQPSTSNSNQRRQTRCVNMTCLLRDLGGLPQDGVRSGKDCKRSFHDYEPLLDSSSCNLRQSDFFYPILPLYHLRENKISRGLCTTKPIKLRLSINIQFSNLKALNPSHVNPRSSILCNSNLQELLCALYWTSFYWTCARSYFYQLYLLWKHDTFLCL